MFFGLGLALSSLSCLSERLRESQSQLMSMSSPGVDTPWLQCHVAKTVDFVIFASSVSLICKVTKYL